MKNIISPAMQAKQYLKNIYTRTELNRILDNVLLTPIELRVFTDVFLYSKSYQMISNDVKLSESSVKRYFKISLEKIYYFLKHENIL